MARDEKVASFGTDANSRFVSDWKSNVKSDLIEITGDKLENILIKNIKKMGVRKGWLAPLGILITVVLANITATFSTKFGISESTWEAIFIIAAIVSAIWLLVSIVAMFSCWKESTVEYLICKITKSDES